LEEAYNWGHVYSKKEFKRQLLSG